MSTEDRHLTWENVARMLERRIGTRVPIHGTPEGELVIGAGGEALALRVMCDIDHVNIPDLPASVAVRAESLDEASWLAVECADSSLFQQFHSFAITILDAVQVEGAEPVVAVRDAVEAWRELLRRPARLSEQQELGLIGELWVLWHLLDRYGAQALSMWTGISREPHDFRLHEIDLEVKSTRTQRRVHTINGLRQLEPVGDTPLWLLSLQFQPTVVTKGATLPQWIDRVTERCASIDASLRLQFENGLLGSTDYDPVRAHLYTTAYALRTEPRLVPIDAAVPSLTTSGLAQHCGESSHRLVAVTYQIDLEGLGIPSSHPDFEKHLFIPNA